MQHLYLVSRSSRKFSEHLRRLCLMWLAWSAAQHTLSSDLSAVRCVESRTFRAESLMFSFALPACALKFQLTQQCPVYPHLPAFCDVRTCIEHFSGHQAQL